MRKEKKGWPSKVKVGYGTRASERGLHPRGLVERFVESESDLEGLDSKVHIVRLSSRLGERRRLIILDRVKSLNIHVANPGKEEARPVGEQETRSETAVESEPLAEEASTQPREEAARENGANVGDESHPEEDEQ